MDLADLIAIEEIRQLKYRYFRAIDTCDLALVADCFIVDSSVDYKGGSYHAEAKGRDNIVAFIEAAFHGGAVAMHQGHHPEITVRGDEAEGLWYLQDNFIDTVSNTVTRGSAYYTDTYVKTLIGWKIMTSAYTRVYEEVGPRDMNFKLTAHYLGEKTRD